MPEDGHSEEQYVVFYDVAKEDVLAVFEYMLGKPYVGPREIVLGDKVMKLVRPPDDSYVCAHFCPVDPQWRSGGPFVRVEAIYRKRG